MAPTPRVLVKVTTHRAMEVVLSKTWSWCLSKLKSSFGQCPTHSGASHRTDSSKAIIAIADNLLHATAHTVRLPKRKG